MLSRTIDKVIQKGVKVVLNISDTGVIKLTRGDTARFSIGILNEISDSAYSISDNDQLSLTVKKKVKDEDALIQKTITGTTLFHIEPEDTTPIKPHDGKEEKQKENKKSKPSIFERIINKIKDGVDQSFSEDGEQN